MAQLDTREWSVREREKEKFTMGWKKEESIIICVTLHIDNYNETSVIDNGNDMREFLIKSQRDAVKWFF